MVTKTVRWGWLICATVCGCSGDESLTFDTSGDFLAELKALRADGMTVVELPVDVVFRGDPIQDGKDVTFRCSESLLFATRVEIEADVPGGRRQGEEEVEVETRGGGARAYLQAPTNGGAVACIASFTTVNKDVLSDRITFEIGPPPLVAAGKGSEQNFDSYFGVQCDDKNVGGFAENRDEIRVNCSVTLKDVTGRNIPHTPVQFYAEAGYMLDEPATANKTRTFTYVIPKAPSQMPRDVIPWDVESYSEFDLIAYDYDPVYAEQNPTDGLVTILAVVRGQESFDDMNLNGEIDSDELWIDEGEPFLDVDDDGGYVSNMDPLPCCDSLGTSNVDGQNGQWDTNVWIGRMTHILWTGVYDEGRSHILGGGDTLEVGGNRTLSLRMVDRFSNPLASHDLGDNIEVSAEGRIRVESGTTIASGGVSLATTTGVILNNVFPAFRFGAGGIGANTVFAGLETTNGLLDGRDWTFSVVDDRSQTSQTQMCVSPQAWNVTAAIQYTIAPDHEDGRFSEREAAIATNGLLEILSPDCAVCDGPDMTCFDN
ncbi:MAG: hypothetical protein A2341_10440 [Deltaproteobacteria bacterium RIFOXYB12_FULL_58_9]|nr:MAG: hypothetical protein A2341_10440 [Deltaproteobacteria bacterium RIFOXYB12_FULL_58_9]